MTKVINNHLPNCNVIHPVKNHTNVVFLKNIVKNKNILVGKYTYYAGENKIDGLNFEKHVTHHYDFYGDKLIIGNFCALGKGINFIMNGANHRMDGISTYPFYIFGPQNEQWKKSMPNLKQLPFKGNTIIGNDVWIGENCVILPGVKIGDGVIIGCNAVVANDIPPYAIAAGNPAKVIKYRFTKSEIMNLQDLKWWDWSDEKITKNLHLIYSKGLLEKYSDFCKIKTLESFSKK